MLEYEVAPLTDVTWVNQHGHVETEFTVTWLRTLADLEREVKLLKGSDVVLHVDAPPRAFRADGRLRADARLHSPAVILTFESKHGPLTYRCDRYLRGGATRWRNGDRVEIMPGDWQHNVRAIGLKLEALRAVERYGGGDGEQYSGYKALGAGTGIASGMTATDALEIIGRAAGLPAFPIAVTEGIIKRARAATHPDTNGGDRTQYNLVDQAVQVLTRAGKIRQEALTS